MNRDVPSLRAAAAEASAAGGHARAVEHLGQALGLAPAGIARGEIQLELAHAQAGRARAATDARPNQRRKRDDPSPSPATSAERRRR